MSDSITEIENLEVFIVTGSNTTETHPVISNLLKRAMRKNGARLIVIDPGKVEMTDFAALWLRQRPGADVAIWQAMAQVVVEEDLYDRRFEGATAHFLLLSLWDSLESIRPSAGEDVRKARYYPEDERFLLRLEPEVMHYEVVGRCT